MRRLAYDLRYAARSLARSPLFASVAVFSLGLALAVNTTIFALADGVMHPYVAYRQPERIIVPTFMGGDPKRALTFDTRYRAIRDGVHAYDGIAAYTLVQAAVQTGTVGRDWAPVGVSAQFFDVLGVRPLVGRTIDTTDAGARATQGAVISYRLWNSRFDRRPLSDDLTLEIARTRYTVIGVMPRGVHFPSGFTDVWIPIDALPAPSRHVGPFAVVHLRSGASKEALWSEMAIVSKRLTTEYTPKRPLSPRLFPLEVYGRAAPFPPLFSRSVLIVLVIACANLGTMLIARGLARRRETAIRIALGASRGAIVRGVLAECGLIVAGSVAVGALLTAWALYVVPHFTTPFVPELGDIDPRPRWRVFVYAFEVAVATVLVAAVVPAIRAASTDPSEPMKDGAGTTTGRQRHRYNPLIMVEVALSTTLLMCSALFTIVVVRLTAFDFQYAAKQLVVADALDVSSARLRGGSVSAYYADLIDRMRRLPGVAGAATQRANIPIGKMVYAEEGKSGDTWINLQSYSIVSPDYLRTMGIPMLRGRDFAPGDGTGDRPVVIVDAAAAARLWPDVRDPVGRMIKLGVQRSDAPWLRVIGVAQAVEYGPRDDPDLPPDPRIYVVAPNDSVGTRQLLVRGTGAGDSARTILALTVRRELESSMPWVATIDVHSWLDNLERIRAAESFLASLFASFAGFGLLLCAVGLYGVLAYTVSRRLREFAVRVALGARARDVAKLVVHDAAVTALAGVGVGAFVALYVTRSIGDYAAFLPSYAHVVALVSAESVLFVVAAAASFAPVRRAAKADPVEVLRAT